MPADEETAAGQPAASDDGVDVTLIRWMLSLTPAQRLDVLQQFVDAALEARAASIQI